MGTQPGALHGLSLENATTGNTLSPRRTGMTVQWDENDTMHPYNMSSVGKWLAVVTVSMGSLCV